MKLSTLVSILNKVEAVGLSRNFHATLVGEDVNFIDITADSAEINAKGLFVARKGTKLDGHDFIVVAKEHGAVAAIVTRFIDTQLPQVLVTDADEALWRIGLWQRQQFNNCMLAVTGSCGKTTTKGMLAAILSHCGRIFASKKSFNNAVGLPLALWSLQPEADFAVLEVGANHHGEIAKLMTMLQPVQVAIITNAEACHLEGFGDVAGVARAKAEIFQGLAPDGVAILNADDQYCQYWQNVVGVDNFDTRPLSKCAPAIVTFGIQSNVAMVRAIDIELDMIGCAEFTLLLPKNPSFNKQPSIRIKLQLPGTHNIMNALAAAAAASAIGIGIDVIKLGLETMIPVGMRMVVHVGTSGARIIDDTYNANPKAVMAALEVLMQQSGEKVFIFGGMRELGSEAAYWHSYIGKFAKDIGVDNLYVCGKFSGLVADAFGEGALAFQDQTGLVAAIRSQLNAAHVVLIKGSRGAAMESVVAALIE